MCDLHQYFSFFPFPLGDTGWLDLDISLSPPGRLKEAGAGYSLPPGQVGSDYTPAG